MTIEQVAEMIAKADEKMNGIAGKLHDFINACPLYTEESRKTCHDIVADSCIPNNPTLVSSGHAFPALIWGAGRNRMNRKRSLPPLT